MTPAISRRTSSSSSAHGEVGGLEPGAGGGGIRRSVSFCEAGPAVRLIPGSAEQRGTDFGKAARGEEQFVRPLRLPPETGATPPSRHGGCQLLVTAALDPESRASFAVAVHPVEEDDPATMAVLPRGEAVAVAEGVPFDPPVADSDDEREQARVRGAAQVLMDCAADMVAAVGVRGMRRMVAGGMKLDRGGPGGRWRVGGVTRAARRRKRRSGSGGDFSSSSSSSRSDESSDNDDGGDEHEYNSGDEDDAAAAAAKDTASASDGDDDDDPNRPRLPPRPISAPSRAAAAAAAEDDAAVGTPWLSSFAASAASSFPAGEWWYPAIAGAAITAPGEALIGVEGARAASCVSGPSSATVTAAAAAFGDALAESASASAAEPVVSLPSFSFGSVSGGGFLGPGSPPIRGGWFHDVARKQREEDEQEHQKEEEKEKEKTEEGGDGDAAAAAAGSDGNIDNAASLSLEQQQQQAPSPESTSPPLPPLAAGEMELHLPVSSSSSYVPARPPLSPSPPPAKSSPPPPPPLAAPSPAAVALAPPPPPPHQRLHTHAHKRYALHLASPLLTLHLKRFGRDARGKLRKLGGHVSFPLELELAEYGFMGIGGEGSKEEKQQVGEGAKAEARGEANGRIGDAAGIVASSFSSSTPPSPPPSGKYSLVGIVEHMGSMRGGHYVAYVRREVDGDEREEQEEGEKRKKKNGEKASSDAAAAAAVNDPAATSSSSSDAEGLTTPLPVPSCDAAVENAPPALASASSGDNGKTRAEAPTKKPDAPLPLSNCNGFSHAECNGRREGAVGGDVVVVEEEEVAQGEEEDKASAEAAKADDAPAAAPPSLRASPKRRFAWFRASDSHVERISVDVVESCEAYILLYAREEEEEE